MIKFRHKKRGSIYDRLGEAKLQYSADRNLEGMLITFYQGEDGQMWCRPSTEFNDGRFEEIEA